MTMQPMLARFTRFALLGLLPTAAYYVFSISFVETGILNPGFALPLGFVAAVVISYQLNRRFTWKPDTPRSRHFHLYVAISLFGALTNYVLYALIVRTLGQNYLYAILAVTVVIPVQNFLLNEKFNFK